MFKVYLAIDFLGCSCIGGGSVLWGFTPGVKAIKFSALSAQLHLSLQVRDVKKTIDRSKER